MSQGLNEAGYSVNRVIGKHQIMVKLLEWFTNQMMRLHLDPKTKGFIINVNNKVLERLEKEFSVDIEWNTELFKDLIWRPVQIAMIKKKSTAQLTIEELQTVYETVNRIVSEKYGVGYQFPSVEQMS
jgi:hypothetical protein